MSSDAILRELTLEITQECMNQCLHCSSRAVRHSASPPINVALMKRIVDEADELGLRSLSISGGEPFLHPHFASILKICADKGFKKLAIYTSGILQSNDGTAMSLFDKDLLSLVKKSEATLIFNVQSCLPEVHDKIVGASGRLTMTLISIRNAIAHGIPVECHIVPNKQNIASLELTARRLVAMGVSRVSFLRLVAQAYAADNCGSVVCSRYEKDCTQAVFNMLAQEDNADKVFRFGAPLDKLGHPSRCQAGLSKLIMRWDGKFFPCEAFKECGRDEFCLGKITAEQSLRDILYKVRNCSALHSLKNQAAQVDPCPAQLLYPA